MITLKKTAVALCIFVTFLSFTSYSQSGKINLNTWNTFKESAHKIGFCIYHVQMEACNQHSKIKQKLEKASDPNSDIYYFEMKPLWAKNRLTELAKRNKSNSNNCFILFDIDQKSFKKLHGSKKTSNSYLKFSIFDLKNKYKFKFRQETATNITFYISSNVEKSILTNTMWREFFSNRLGRIDSEIKISIKGKNALDDYQNFKKDFVKFIEK
jgi:hypothetical protein